MEFAASIMEQNSFNPTLVKKAFCRYDSIMKSLPDTVAQNKFRIGAIKSLSDTAYDPLTISIRFITLSPKEFGYKIASDYANSVSNGNASAKQFGQHLKLINKTAQAIGLSAYITETNKYIQEYIDSLPLVDQMRIYASSTTPEVLAATLRNLYNQPNADKAEINQQMDALRSVYSPSDYNIFIKNFNLKQ